MTAEYVKSVLDAVEAAGKPYGMEASLRSWTQQIAESKRRTVDLIAQTKQLHRVIDEMLEAERLYKAYRRGIRRMKRKQKNC